MHNIRKQGDLMMNTVQVDGLQANSPLDKFTTFDTNDCSYSGSTHNLMVNWFHPLFLKSTSAASKADNPNWS